MDSSTTTPKSSLQSNIQALHALTQPLENGDPLLTTSTTEQDHDATDRIPPVNIPTPETVQRRLREFVRRFGNYLAYLTVIMILILTPIVLYRALSDRKVDQAAYNSARIMVIGTIILSIRLVYLHLTHWYMPDVQKYVVRIIWMVPLYSVQSYLSLRHHKSRVYIDSVRDFYEAYVIASFVYYLMELLGGEDALIDLLRRKDPNYGKHKFPLNLILDPWAMGEDFTLQCKHGVLQYVVFKCFSTLLTFVCVSANVYGEGKFKWLAAYPYLCFLQNLSVMYALYCLVMLYHAIEQELRTPVNWQPLGKFLCVKGIVFFCWWQGVLIFYLKDHGIIDKLGSWSSNEVANGLIDYCVVVEMIGFAIAHSYTFTYKEYLPRSLSDAPRGATGSNEGSDERSASPPQHYRPPATLQHPMNFQDALWSSTVPRETLNDIKDINMLSRLRRNVSSSSSLQNPRDNEGEEENEEPNEMGAILNSVI